MLTVFKQYEGWDINLKVKLKDSLNIKVFLWIFGALVVCCLVIYGSIMLFLPKSYEMILSARMESEIEKLSKVLCTDFDFADFSFGCLDLQPYYCKTCYRNK